MKQTAYKINRDRKTITINDSVKQTAADKQDIMLYVAAGYEIRHKNMEKAKEAAKKADTITADKIRKLLDGDKEALEEFNRLNKVSGFFTARKFYNDYVKDGSEEQKVKRSGRKPAAGDKES